MEVFIVSVKDYHKTSHPIPLRTDQLVIENKRMIAVTYLRPKQFSCVQYEVSDILVSFPPSIHQISLISKSLPYAYVWQERDLNKRDE